MLERHIERKLPKQNVTENYTRSAKTLVQVKTADFQAVLTDSDKGLNDHKAFKPVGHKFEMVLLDSPFSDSATLRLKLIFQGLPVGGRQVEMFSKADETIRLTTLTNNDGIATFKLLGEGEYLLNAVLLSEPKNMQAHWASHWASIAFKTNKH